MILLADLVRIPDPFPKELVPPVSADTVRAFRIRMSKLVTICLRNGVLNREEAREFVKKAQDVLGTVEDLQHRITLREVMDNGDVYDLRIRWKEEYRKFFRFRDILRDSLNLLVQHQFMQIEVGDNVKREVDGFYSQLIEIDKTIRSALRRL
jgi:hypothetical protein